MAIISNLYQDRKPEKRRYRVRYRLGPRGQSFTLNKEAPKFVGLPLLLAI